jgi:hypothetical protein
MAEKITSVVAPQRPDDDDEDEEDYSEDEEYEEGDDEVVEEYQEQSSTSPSNRSPFSLVGMISRVMEPEQKPIETEESNSNEEEASEHLDILADECVETDEQKEPEIEVQEKPPLFRYDSPADQFAVNPTSLANSRVRPRSYSPRNGVFTSIPRVHHNEQKGSSSFSNALERAPVRDTNYDPDHGSEHEPEPARFSLVRESGSVTPQSIRKASVGARLGISPNRLSARALGPTTSSGDETRLSPLRKIAIDDSFSTASSDLTRNESHLSKQPLDSLLGSFPQVSEAESVDTPNNSALSREAAPLEIERSLDQVSSAPAVQEKQRGTRREDSGVLPQKMSSAASRDTASRGSSLPSIYLGAMDETDDDEEGEDKDDAHASPGQELANQPLNTGNWSTATAEMHFSGDADRRNGSVETPVATGETMQTSLALEMQCKDLNGQLANAENRIAELQQQISTLLERDSCDKENLAQQYREKEARLMQSSAEAHEEEIQALKKEMDEKIMSVQRQLFEERSLYQQQQSEMKSLLTDADDRIQHLEQQLQQERTAKEEFTSSTQQQQVRALRITEDKLVQAMARLDERNETVEQLTSVIKSMESKLSEQKAGVIDAEKEMAALDTENEDLHNQVEKLKLECAELRKMSAKHEGDSEKLVHLKVRTVPQSYVITAPSLHLHSRLSFP